MKKIMLTIPVALLFLASCTKSESTNPKSNQASSKPNLQHYARPSSGYGNFVQWSINPDLPCVYVTSNCIEVVIVGKQAKLDALNIAISNGPGAIGTFFSNTSNWDVFPDPSVESMNNLASGNYNIIRKSDVSGGSDDYYFCGPTTTLTVNNPEFVVGVTNQD